MPPDRVCICGGPDSEGGGWDGCRRAAPEPPGMSLGAVEDALALDSLVPRGLTGALRSELLRRALCSPTPAEVPHPHHRRALPGPPARALLSNLFDLRKENPS
jgi:hypothetical protein